MALLPNSCVFLQKKHAWCTARKYLFIIKTKLQSGRLGVPAPEGARHFSFLQGVQARSGAHLDPYSMCTEVLFRGKATGRVGNHSAASSAKVKQQGSCACAPLHAFMAWTGEMLLYQQV